MTNNEFITEHYDFIKRISKQYNVTEDCMSEAIMYCLEYKHIDKIASPKSWLRKMIYLMMYSPRSKYNKVYKWNYDEITEGTTENY